MHEICQSEFCPIAWTITRMAGENEKHCATTDEVELADLKNEKFVTMNDGFATAQRFRDAFSEAGFEPVVVTRLNDIFSLMNMVQAGIGLSLVPGRIGKVFSNSVRLAGLAEKYRKKQMVALVFQKNRERDPDLLALVAEARMIACYSIS